MNIKYNKKKQESREDPVIDGIFKTKEFFEKNSRNLIVFIVLIIIVTGGISGFNYYKKSQQIKARESFGKAMVAYSTKNFDDAIDQFRLTSETFKGTITGTTSAYMLGSILFQQKQLDEAITWYESVINGHDAGFVTGQAFEGLASCYELKKDTASALKYFESALNDGRIDYRRNALRWKIALLSRKSDVTRAKKLCEEIIADTLAQDYRLNAEYLLATL